MIKSHCWKCDKAIQGDRRRRATGLRTDRPLCGKCAVDRRKVQPVRMTHLPSWVDPRSDLPRTEALELETGDVDDHVDADNGDALDETR
jgi:hypothetical protein